MVKKEQMTDAIAGAATTGSRRADDVTTLEVVLHETSVRDLKLQRCIAILSGWVNSVIEPSRMLVQDFFDDLYDAKILIKLIEIKTGIVLPASLSAMTYKAILENVKSLTNYMTNTLGIHPEDKWTPEGIASKRVNAILFLVKDLAIHFGMPDPLPSNIQLVCVFKEKKEAGHIERKVVRFPFTDSVDTMAEIKRIQGGSDDEAELAGDVFDKLLLASEDKVDQVRQLLLAFVNKHLSKLTGRPTTVTAFSHDFADGVLFIQLLGILGGFYIARNEYYTDAQNAGEKGHNFKVVIAIMVQHGVEVGGLKKQEMMLGSEGDIMRAAYRIYQQFKNVQ